MSLTGLQPRVVDLNDSGLEGMLIREGHKVMSSAAKKRKQEGRAKDCETNRRTEATYIEVGKYNPTNPNKDIQNKGIIGLLPALACSYDKCGMCDFGGDPTLTEITEEQIAKYQISEFERVVVPAFMKYNSHDNDPDFVPMYNIIGSASFFDEKEIPAKSRAHILNRIAEMMQEDGRVGVFATESRLEYINRGSMEELREKLGDDARIEVGFGYESTSELVNEGLINKARVRNYKDKMNLMHEYGIEIAAHVFLGAAALNERERIEEAAVSIIRAKGDGADRILLMTANLKLNSTYGYLAEQNEYELPMLWSTLEAAKIAADQDKSVLDGMLLLPIDAPVAFESPINCDSCTMDVMAKMAEFNGSLDSDVDTKYKILKEALDIACDCKYDWIQKVNDGINDEPLQMRIRRMYDKLEAYVNEDCRCD